MFLYLKIDQNAFGGRASPGPGKGGAKSDPPLQNSVHATANVLLPRNIGATENASNDNARPSKLQGLTTREYSGLMVMINSD